MQRLSLSSLLFVVPFLCTSPFPRQPHHILGTLIVGVSDWVGDGTAREEMFGPFPSQLAETLYGPWETAGAPLFVPPFQTYIPEPGATKVCGQEVVLEPPGRTPDFCLSTPALSSQADA